MTDREPVQALLEILGMLDDEEFMALLKSQQPHDEVLSPH